MTTSYIAADFSTFMAQDEYQSGFAAARENSARAIYVNEEANSIDASHDEEYGDFYVIRTLLRFPTASIALDIVSKVNLKLVAIYDGSDEDLDIYITKCACNWSPTFIPGEEEPPSSEDVESTWDSIISSPKDVTWRNTSGISINTPYVSPDMDVSWVNTDGVTYYGLCAARDFNGSPEPTNWSFITIASYTNIIIGYRPVLVVEHSPLPPTLTGSQLGLLNRLNWTT